MIKPNEQGSGEEWLRKGEQWLSKDEDDQNKPDDAQSRSLNSSEEPQDIIPMTDFLSIDEFESLEPKDAPDFY